MTTNLREIVGQVADAATVLAGIVAAGRDRPREEAGRAVSEIASAINEIADGAGRQVHMVDQARLSAEETGAAAAQTESIAAEGVGAAEQASVAMEALQASTGEVTRSIRAAWPPSRSRSAASSRRSPASPGRPTCWP